MDLIVSCITCKYSHEIEVSYGEGLECRRYPPQILSPYMLCRFPRVFYERDFCGEFKESNIKRMKYNFAQKNKQKE